jgi:phosphohistidine phosphatase SixA
MSPDSFLPTQLVAATFGFGEKRSEVSKWRANRNAVSAVTAGVPCTISLMLEAESSAPSPVGVMRQLAKIAKRRRIALVGHEPALGELAAHLLGASRAMPFKKGGVCRVEIESLTSKPVGTLIWFVGPKVLRGLGR